MFTPIAIPIIVPGSLGATITVTFKAPCDMTLQTASACAQNDSDATWKIGTTADDDLYMEEIAVGDSGVPTEYDADDFVNDIPIQIRKGTNVEITVDHDGDGGTAAQNLTAIAWFTPG